MNFTNIYNNTKISSNQQGKIHNVSHPLTRNKACKDTGKHDQNEEKNQIMKTDPEQTQMLELAKKSKHLKLQLTTEQHRD